MALYDLHRPASGPAPLAGFLGRLIARHDRRRTARQLAGLTDAQLDDIGLARADIARWTARQG